MRILSCDDLHSISKLLTKFINSKTIFSHSSLSVVEFTTRSSWLDKLLNLYRSFFDDLKNIKIFFILKFKIKTYAYIFSLYIAFNYAY